MQSVASHCDYFTLLQAIASHGKLLQCKLLQGIAATASNCIASYCKPFQLLLAIASQAIANLAGIANCCKLLEDPSCKLFEPSRLLQAITYYMYYYIILQSIASYESYCKPSRLSRRAIAGYGILWQAMASYCLLLANYYELLQAIAKLSQTIAKLLPAVASCCKILQTSAKLSRAIAS